VTSYDTTDEAVVAELISKLDAARRIYDYWKLAQRTGEYSAPRPTSIDEIGKALLSLLERHPVFHRNSQRWFGPKQLHQHPWQASRFLFKIAIERGPAEAVSWLHKVYATESADLRFVAEVEGLQIDQPFSLSNGVHFVRLAALPKSPMNSAVLGSYSFHGNHFNFRMPLPPVIAVYEHKNLPATLGYDGPHESIEIERAVRSLVAADRRASPVVGTSWLDLVDPDLEAFHVGLIWGTSRFDGPHGGGQTFNIDSMGIDRANAFLRSGATISSVLDVAADRLILARRRFSAANKVIDGAICLEALLLSDPPTAEMTYRMRLRAALLLGRNEEEKRQLQKSVGEFCQLRGRAVHRGSTVKKDGDAAIVRDGLEICARVLDAIIALGEMPSWMEWEFAGGNPKAARP
jgi:hypothetical protein